MEDMAWYALRVHSHRESAVGSLLLARGYDSFVPEFAAPRSKKPRALFPGYVFCRMHTALGEKIVTTPGVLSVVAFGRRWASIQEHEVMALKKLMESELPSRPWIYIPNGTRVRVEGGPLRSAEGILLDNRNLILSVSLLGRSSSVILPNDTVLTVIFPNERGNSHFNLFDRIALNVCAGSELP